MSTGTIKTVVERFLESESPGVLVLKGAWGVGKTYFWNKLLIENKERFKPESYCYVSLFGIQTLNELRVAIFAKSIPKNLVAAKIDARTVNRNWFGFSKSALKRIADSGRRFIEVLPYGKGINIGIETIAPYFVGSTLICIDDFERLSPQIDASEVLGLLSSLKEERGCKIILIFNEQKLERNAEKYRTYREKIVDIELLYSPTALEAAELVFPANLEWRVKAVSRSVSLDIKNIRVLRRIESVLSLIGATLGNLHEKVVEQVVQTTVLLSYCYFEPGADKPALEFLKKYDAFTRGFERAREGRGESEIPLEPPEYAMWEKILDDYGFTQMDELDLAIMKLVEQGYIEDTGFIEQANRAHEKSVAEDHESSFSNVWGLFHNTFADNRRELIDGLRDAFKRSVRYITPLNLNGTVRLFRELEEQQMADELIEIYIRERGNEAGLFDLSSYAFSGEVTDSRIQEKFGQLHNSNARTPTLREAARSIGGKDGWSGAESRAMDAASEEDFYELFKSELGEDFRRIIKGSIRYGSVGGNQAIGGRVNAALDKIAAESKLNSIRVRRFRPESRQTR